MSLDLLHLLTGDDNQFAQGLVALGWYEYAPVLTDYCFMGKARACLDPQFKAAGEVRDTDAWVYRLDVPTGKWQDAVAIVESHLKQEPQFAVVFCNLPSALLILVPSNPDKAFGKAKSGLDVDRVYLDTRHSSNFEIEAIKKLEAAPKKQFRARLQEMVDTERVTKDFYKGFKKELDSFQALIEGIPLAEDKDRLWYSSVMLNRLMFAYFLQRKGFLNGEDDYLSNRLKMVKDRWGSNKFGLFYRRFLLRLFHEGLGSRKRDAPDFEELLGKVPYLNGGLFDIHELEKRYSDPAGNTYIDIPDAAFKSVFDFFDKWEWCLDTRPARTNNEINPDVLGYIFEKYINQKQMGAYYTKEDITDYISKNTIIPYLFDATREKHPSAFKGEDSIWSILQIEPDRYIYEAVRTGVDLPLPEDIEIGVNDVSERDRWNTRAPEEFALPTEIWREVVARRQRCTELRSDLASGEIQSIDEVITHNLDIKCFVQDVIDLTDDPELVRHVWNVMAGRLPDKSNEKPIPAMSILDPTCGSGAFLFAALNILEPLYGSCLGRMQQFVRQADANGDSAKYPDFRRVLAWMDNRDEHPNRDYFILKSIILGNLYGVDIMEEAVEICKLRLFLKLAAQVEPDDSKENYGLEPLPDIDFNIRSGNTLVGFATREEVRKATSDSSGQSRLDLDGESEAFKEIDEAADLADRAFQRFHEMQVLHGMDDNEFADAKQHLRDRLKELSDRLNVYLAKQYVIDAHHHKPKYDAWLKTHQPFHWFAEFYGMMKRGGFDVVIGNPPYVEYSKVSQTYCIRKEWFVTSECGNLFALVCERALSLLTTNGRSGLIVLLASFGTDRMLPLQDLYRKRCRFVAASHYEATSHPSVIFVGVEAQLSIILARAAPECPSKARVFTTKYIRTYSVERPYLFDRLNYVQIPLELWANRMPRVESRSELSILQKLSSSSNKQAVQQCGALQPLLFRSMGNFFWKLAFTREPRFEIDGVQSRSSTTVTISVPQPREVTQAIILSSLFYWRWSVYSDVYHLSKVDIAAFPLDARSLAEHSSELVGLAKAVEDELFATAKLGDYQRKNGRYVFHRFFPHSAKPIIDQIDLILGECAGLSAEELDLIINYEIRYRMAINGNSEVEEDEE